MKFRLTTLAIIVALVAVFAFAPSGSSTVVAKNPELLKAMPVDGVLSDGGKFKGEITITELALDDSQRSFVAKGIITGKAHTKGKDHNVKEAFKDVSFTVESGQASGSGISPQTHETLGYCQVLFLTIGPIDLNLLGLRVIIPNPIVIDIRAYPSTDPEGRGGLLGDLLCAVSHLLGGTLGGARAPAATRQ